jgi:hypothetical protein
LHKFQYSFSFESRGTGFSCFVLFGGIKLSLVNETEIPFEGGALTFFEQGFRSGAQCGFFIDAASAAFSRSEIVTEIRAIFFAHDIGLGFTALVVDFGIIEITVFTDMHVGPTARALIASTHNPQDGNLFTAIKTD